MKLRIEGNSLRLRLTKTEVKAFEDEGLVSDKISFGNASLIYTLKETDQESLQVSYDDNKIIVGVPSSVKTKWLQESEVGFDTTMKLGDEELYILVEKDFQCMVPRSEDESDLFRNPLAKTNGE